MCNTSKTNACQRRSRTHNQNSETLNYQRFSSDMLKVSHSLSTISPVKTMSYPDRLMQQNIEEKLFTVIYVPDFVAESDKSIKETLEASVELSHIIHGTESKGVKPPFLCFCQSSCFQGKWKSIVLSQNIQIYS